MIELILGALIVASQLHETRTDVKAGLREQQVAENKKRPDTSSAHNAS